MKYASPEEFRQKLEQHILELANDQDRVAELRSEVAFERALARFDYQKWILKGGYAIRLLLSTSRYTGDLDMVLNRKSIKHLSLEERAAFVTEVLRKELSKDLHDQFEFAVKQSIPIADLEPENLAAIALIDVQLAGDNFCKMRIDVGVSDHERLSGEHVRGQNLLEFADIENPDIVIDAREQIFADKLLAYCEQGKGGMRWGDLVDMQLLIDTGLDVDKICKAMGVTESRQGKKFQKKIDRPPKHWEDKYSKEAHMRGLPVPLDAAFDRLQKFATPLFRQFRKW